MVIGFSISQQVCQGDGHEGGMSEGDDAGIADEDVEPDDDDNADQHFDDGALDGEAAELACHHHDDRKR
jgi:hypothetical protein